MRRFSLGLIATAALMLASVSLAHAQTSNTGCQPAPAGATAIVCYGTTPCPAGYIDPVGGGARNSLYNSNGLFQTNPLVPQSSQRWLCQLSTAVQENSGISTTNGAITGPAGSGIGSTSATTGSGATSTGGATALPLSVSTSVSTGSGTTTTTTNSTTTAAASPPVPTTSVLVTSNATAGSFLTTSTGMTLYEHSGDSNGVSTCDGSCAIIWTPFAPPASGSITAPSSVTGTFAVMTRDDGSQQVTYNGYPLYTYTGDINAGDTNGSGLAGIWTIATP